MKRRSGLKLLLCAMQTKPAILGLFALFSFRCLAQGSVTFPKLTGEYAVGRVGFTWVDPHRPDPFGPAADSKRELVVWVWYPAAASDNSTPAEYLPGKWGEYNAEEVGRIVAVARARGRGAQVDVQRIAPDPDGISVIRNAGIHAIADAPVSPRRPRYPLLLFLPGINGIATDYTSLLESEWPDCFAQAGCIPGLAEQSPANVDGRHRFCCGPGNPIE
jgi:hypothetical protein